MTTLSPFLAFDINDYTQLDRVGLEDRLKSLYYQLNPNYDDFSSNHPENLMLAGQCIIASLIVGAMDERIRQIFWATLSDRKAAIKKARPLNFQLTGREAAQVTVYFRLPNSQTASSLITIPARTRIMSNNNVFETTEATTIAVGAPSSSTLTAENAQQQSDTFYSDGTPNQEFQLSYDNIIDNSHDVNCADGEYSNEDDTGTIWNSFLDMKPSSKGYIFYTDNEGRGYIRFGNGIYGSIPAEGDIIVDYKAGGGAIGGVEANSNWQILDTITDGSGSAVTLQVVNSAISTTGIDEMTVEEAKIRGPRHRRLIRAAVNEDQFETVATQVSGIALAAIMTSNHDSSIDEDNANLYCVAYGTAYSVSGYFPPTAPTTAQLAEVQAKIAQTGDYPAFLDFTVTAYTAEFTTVNVSVRVKKSSGASATQTKSAITNALQKLFAVATDTKERNEVINFGFKLLDSDGDPDYKVVWSMVHNAIYDLTEVREIPPSDTDLLLNGYRSSVILDARKVPQLGSITVYDMDQGGVEI